MENTIRKIFKINLDISFDTNISPEQQDHVKGLIGEIDAFLLKEKTQIQLYKHFFMDYDPNCILEKLTSSKYLNEYFLFKSVPVKIGISSDSQNLKSNTLLLEDFQTEVYKEKLNLISKNATSIKKESNWSLLSLRDLLDVDHKKQTDKADSFFILKNYTEACNIYSKYKMEDDFSHYNMEMEVYSRLLSELNPYVSLIHLTNTNFVNSFYHHRLVLVLLLLDQNDLCFRISRLLVEPFRMFIDLELSKRFLNQNSFFRKGLEMLFFCILYYKGLDFPCHDLIDVFLKSVDRNEKLLNLPINYLEGLEQTFDDSSSPKKDLECSYFDDLHAIKSEKIHILTFVQSKTNDNALFCVLNDQVDVDIHDIILLLSVSNTMEPNNDVINLNDGELKIIESNLEMTDLLSKHVILEHETELHSLNEDNYIFSLREILKRINIKDKSLIQIKGLKFEGEGCIRIEDKGDNDKYHKKLLFIKSESHNRVDFESEHTVYQYQNYTFKLEIEGECTITIDGILTRSNNINLRFEKTGVFYKKVTVSYLGRFFTTFVKFTVVKLFDFDFSWSKILPSILNLDLHKPTDEMTHIKIYRAKDNSKSTGGLYQIIGEVQKSDHHIMDDEINSLERISEVVLENGSFIDKLKRDVLGIQEPYIEDFYTEAPEINSPVESSLDFSDYLRKGEDLKVESRGKYSIQFAPTSIGSHFISLKTSKLSFLVPFNVSFIPIASNPFVFIFSSSLIRKNAIVKIFCLVNNYYDKDIHIRMDSNTVEVDPSDCCFTCKPLKSTIYELRCKFSGLLNNNEINLSVFSEEKVFYKNDLLIDLKVSDEQ